MRVLFSILVAAAAGVTMPPSLTAQDEPVPAEMVRVTVDTATMRELGQGKRRFTGIVMDTSAESIGIRLQSGHVLLVPRDKVTKLEVSHGTQSQAGRGGMKGAIIGGSIGALSGIIIVAGNCGECSGDSYGVGIIPLAILGDAALGALIGVIAGSFPANRCGRWSG